MGRDTKIEWAHSTFSPWWGCAKVSEGCRFCYAEAFAKRTGHDVWGPDKPRRMLSDRHWQEPLKWNRAAAKAGVRHRVFCGSMCDWAEIGPGLDTQRARLFQLIYATPNLLWLTLTKRPGNLPAVTPPNWRNGWPSNVVAMATVEDQAVADKRINELLEVLAPLHALSIEPLIGYVFLRDIHLSMLDWVIVGCESGPNRRPCRSEWIESIVRQCYVAGVPVFVKQAHDESGRVVKMPSVLGRVWDQVPEVLK